MSENNDRQANNGKTAKPGKGMKIRWPLVAYDVLMLLTVQVFLLVIYGDRNRLAPLSVLAEIALSMACIFVARSVGGVYRLVWRYGGIQSYIRLILADAVGGLAYVALERLLPMKHVAFDRILAICAMNLLLALSTRMIYRYAYKFGNDHTPRGRFLRMLIDVFAPSGTSCVGNGRADQQDAVSIAIVGAGNIGVSLAEELINTASAAYKPRCFVDVDESKIGRRILDVPVFAENDETLEVLKAMQVQEVVFAIPHLPDVQRKGLYERYLNSGFRIKKYDYPMMQSASGKRQLREFDIEELLFRKTIRINNEETKAYYCGKTILITGGGGSIGSELSRQIAKMAPKTLILLDIYENGVYDVQQELRLAYGASLDLRVEIVSITGKAAMDRVFADYRPDVVINAAAHKHVPLMEHNCIEAVENNVFGTRNLVELCEKYGTGRFMMVSTDKAVNPTNVMGATKRMCELIVQSASTHGKTVYSATRFGNVLGSAGSVIPLFKRQIANGGPVTLTDRRIIRYFMTIPEAAMLVLESGAMAKNGELFVLDMGQPIRIAKLAEAMIRLSGAHGIEIVETGLRPGEKLYEELLVKTEELDKTSNQLIFIERDTPLDRAEIEKRLETLENACATGSNDAVREALHQVVPTYRTPEEVNAEAEKAHEMAAVQAGDAQVAVSA